MSVELSWLSVLVLGIGIVVGFTVAYIRRGPKAMMPLIWNLLDIILREVDITINEIDDELIRNIVRKSYDYLLEYYPTFKYLPKEFVEDLVVAEWNRTKALYLLHREAMAGVEVRLVSAYSHNGRGKV